MGVQVGAMVTRMVTGSQIRGFYALTILAGFVNRCCALPRKLADLGYISLSRDSSVLIERAGTVLFFTLLGIFAVWIIAVFSRNVGELRARTVGPAGRLVADARKLKLGLAGLVLFSVAMAMFLFPFSGDRSALAWSDNLFNELSKSSANFVSEAEGRARKTVGQPVDLGVHPRDLADRSQIVRLLRANGFQARITDDDRVRVSGDLGRLALAATADAEAAFRNDRSALQAKYGTNGYEPIYHWWTVFDGLTRRYVQENRGTEADFAKFMSSKVLEPAYNFRGIRCCDIGGNAFPAAVLLVFYVAYTLWYGFSILNVFEGLGISASPGGKKTEA